MANYKGVDTAPISVISGWEVWNGSAWVAASAIPTAGDVAYANGFIKVIDQNWTVTEISNTTFQGTVNDGSFHILSAGITFSGNRRSVRITPYPVLYVSFGGGTSTVLGMGITEFNAPQNACNLRIAGQAGGVLNLEHSGGAESQNRHATETVGNGAGFIINVTSAQAGPGTNTDALRTTGSSNYVINNLGTTTPSTLTANVYNIDGTNNLLVNYGVITGSTFTAGLGASVTGPLCHFINRGVCQATSTSVAVNATTPWITLGDGSMLISTEQNPAVVGRIRVDDGAGVQWLTKSPTTSDVYLYTASELTGYPLESKVEDGTVYGPSSEFEGTMEPWDATFAQALATAQRDLQLPSILSAITAP